MSFYTARINYSGDDRLDITAAGQHPIGKIFAPTWDIVKMWQNAKKIAEKTGDRAVLDKAEACYKVQYREQMMNSLRNNTGMWIKVLSQPVVTVVCYCPKGTFCHRYQLMDIFTELGAIYIGER
ncbi:MAG TPA: hypothetical protein VI911_07045 [Patescibacteria group bacterium]|nr:hypothetical protein [Patescibacteria group bacterium]